MKGYEVGDNYSYYGDFLIIDHILDGFVLYRTFKSLEDGSDYPVYDSLQEWMLKDHFNDFIKEWQYEGKIITRDTIKSKIDSFNVVNLPNKDENGNPLLACFKVDSTSKKVLVKETFDWGKLKWVVVSEELYHEST